MNKKFLFIAITLAAFAFGFSSCESLRGSKIYLFYHNTTARFNAYFNAKEKMIDIEDRLFDSHVDNYNKILDIFTSTDEKNVKGYTADNDLVIAKCSKIIVKHDVSKWVKNAYFLIGKAYFYKRDFYTAIETFEYVSEKYPDDQVGQDAKVWLLRCYIGQEKWNDAQALISAYNADKKFPILSKPYFKLAEADYSIKTGDYKTAIAGLEYAIPRTKVRKLRARYMFILAQLYQATGENEKSANYYKAVIKHSPTYDLSFQARLNLAEVSSNTDKVEKFLTRLLKDDKNIDYYDQIYYTLAKVELKKGNTDQALKYLKMSTRVSKHNDNQKALSYVMEGDIYFKIPQYGPAKLYYDSAAKFVNKDYPDYEAFKARQGVLGNLITNLVTVQLEDSLLRISKLDTAAINNLIDGILEKNKENALNKNKNNNADEDQLTPSLNIPGSNGGGSGNESYFYNALALSQGYSDFLSKWGNRPRTDDWRRKNRQTTGEDNQNGQNGQNSENQGEGNNNGNHPTQGTMKNMPAARQKYFAEIPFTPSQKNIANVKIQDALYSIGNIYFNNLDDHKKAEATLEDLLTRYPDGNYVVQAHYNLYTFYTADSNKEKAEYHKNIILTKYPGSIYAQLIVNPDVLREKYKKSQKNEELEKFYAQAYQHFMANDCQALANDVNESNTRFTKNYLKPKFEYLLLVCNGKKDSVGKFIESLKGFMKKYPGENITSDVKSQIEYLESLQTKEKNTQLSKDSAKAKEQILGTKPKEKVEYQKTENQPHQFVIVIPAKSNSNVVKTALTNYNSENYASQGLQILTFLLDENRQVVLVKNFNDYKQALQYYKELERDPKFYANLGLSFHQEFVISDTNLSLFIKHTDVEGYSDFFKENYLP